jgi:hypothetical protein
MDGLANSDRPFELDKLDFLLGNHYTLPMVSIKRCSTRPERHAATADPVDLLCGCFGLLQGQVPHQLPLQLMAMGFDHHSLLLQQLRQECHYSDW